MALLQTFIVMSLFSFVTLQEKKGFTCYKCSYGIQTEGNRRECIENPDELGNGAHLPCNSTSYCVIQEQYDIHQDKVTSYFRSCSGKTWGSRCEKDWSHVTCKFSCQGNYCNIGEKGERYKAYLAKHGDNSVQDHNGTQPAASSSVTFVVCLIVTSIRKWLT